MDRVKRIASITGVVLIASMYLISLICAIFASEKAPGLFLASVFCSVVIPIMIYGFIVIYKLVHKNDVENFDETKNSDTSNK